MTIKSISGKIQTVLGTIDPSALGVTLTHEHLLIDLSVSSPPKEAASEREFYEKPVSIETLGRIKYYGASNEDNSHLFDVDIAIKEVERYKQFGGDSLVDATSVGIARDPLGLSRISRATGVNVIMGASYYVAAAHPHNMDSLTETDITNKIVTDIATGAEGTTIKSGIIGEIGCSWPLDKNEHKVLKASAKAQRLTGAPILIHPGRDETSPLEILEVLRQSGADINRTIIGHLDRTVFKRTTLEEIARSGCYMEWDLFGREESFYPLNPNIDMPNDAKKMDDIAWISELGYEDKVVVAHDICSKHRLETYGGHGYYYILDHIAPRMRKRGYSENAVHKILVQNPQAILTFTDPSD